MTDRDRLIELLEDTLHEWECDVRNETLSQIAEHLIENGVIVPPCKVGDMVYVVSRYYAGDWEVYKCNIDSITIYEKNTFISCVANDIRFGKINFGLNVSEIGETVFLTKEEAEEELRELQKNDYSVL